MLDLIRRALGKPTSEDIRNLNEQTPGTVEYARAIDEAVKAAGYDTERRNLFWHGVWADKLNVYRNASGWQVQEWLPPYDRSPNVPLAEWQPSERFKVHIAAEGQG